MTTNLTTRPIFLQQDTYKLSQASFLQEMLIEGHEDALYAPNERVYTLQEINPKETLAKQLEARIQAQNGLFQDPTSNIRHVLISNTLFLPTSFKNVLSYDEIIAYFATVVHFFNKKFGKEHMLNAYIHFEEFTHLHILQFPVHADTGELAVFYIKDHQKAIERELNQYISDSGFFEKFQAPASVVEDILEPLENKQEEVGQEVVAEPVEEVVVITEVDQVEEVTEVIEVDQVVADDRHPETEALFAEDENSQLSEDMDNAPVQQNEDYYQVAITSMSFGINDADALDDEIRSGFAPSHTDSEYEYISIGLHNPYHRILNRYIENRLSELHQKGIEIDPDRSYYGVSYLFKPSQFYIERMTRDEIIQYFEYVQNFFEHYFGKRNFMSAEAHISDDQPHLHIQIFGFDYDSQTINTEIIQEPSFIDQLKADFGQVMQIYGYRNDEAFHQRSIDLVPVSNSQYDNDFKQFELQPVNQQGELLSTERIEKINQTYAKLTNKLSHLYGKITK